MSADTLGGAPLSEEAARRRWVGRSGVRRILRSHARSLSVSCAAPIHSPGNVEHARWRNDWLASRLKRRCRTWRLGRRPHSLLRIFQLIVLRGIQRVSHVALLAATWKGKRCEASKLRSMCNEAILAKPSSKLGYGVCSVREVFTCAQTLHFDAATAEKTPLQRSAPRRTAKVRSYRPTLPPRRGPPNAALIAREAPPLHRALTCQTRRRCGPACGPGPRYALR